MLSGDGNQVTEIGRTIYHYATWEINPNLQQPDLDYLESPPLVRSRRELTLGRGSAELRSGTRQPLGLGAGGPSGPKGRGLCFESQSLTV